MGEKKNFVMLSNGMRIERKILNQKNEASNMITKTSISRNPGIRITDRKGTQEEINSTLKKPIKTKNSLSTEMYEKKPAEIQSPTLKNTETYQRAKFKRKKSALSKRKVFSLPPGIVRESFVCFHREFQFYQVKHINDGKVWLLNSKNEELCITFETAVKRRMEHVSPFHIGVLKAFANKENQVVDMLLHAPVNKSIKIIKATGYKPVHFGLMKKFLLGSVFNENQWNEWKNRIIEELDLPKNSLIRPTPQLSKSTHIIKPQNFIVRVQSFNCINKNHTLQSIQAEVPIRTNGSNCITSRIIPAGYCEQCKRYYILSSILEEHYEVMRYALCDFVLDKDINKYLQSLNTEKSEFAYQSILNKCGYSVSQKSSLSSDDRIILLRSIIDNNILSREAIKSFINWLINFHGANPLMKDALAEWKTDLHALATDSRAPIIRVRSIKG